MELPQEFWSELSFLPKAERSALEKSYSADPWVAIRLNSRKWPNAELEPVPWNTEGFYLPHRPSFTSDPLFHAGAYYVQEPSSMVVGTLMRDIRASFDRQVVVLDLCGAPGGKSTDIASQLRRGDVLLSNEVINSRVQVLKENVIKWGAADHHVCSNDPSDFQRLPGTFDIVLVDAPCSGEGLFRKDRAAIDQWSLDAVDFCQKRQLRILEDVWDSLKEGGVLIYSTCTLNQKENEGVLGEIKQKYEVAPFGFEPPSPWGFRTYEVDGFPLFKVFPHLVNGEGFCFFTLRKVEAAPTMKTRKSKKQRDRSSPPDLRGQLGALDLPLYAEEDRVLSYADDDLMNRFQQHLRMVRKGTMLGTLKKGKLVPSHEMAMSTHIDKSGWPTYELSFDQAIRFLQKGSLELPCKQKGFGLVSFRKVPLGWINHLGHRVNNLYPSEYRILTQSATFLDPEII